MNTRNKHAHPTFVETRNKLDNGSVAAEIGLSPTNLNEFVGSASMPTANANPKIYRTLICRISLVFVWCAGIPYEGAFKVSPYEVGGDLEGDFVHQSSMFNADKIASCVSSISRSILRARVCCIHVSKGNRLNISPTDKAPIKP